MRKQIADMMARVLVLENVESSSHNGTERHWIQLCQPKYDHLRLKCWASTGCLLTVDGNDDHLAKLEVLPSYAVPPPLLCELINVQQVQPQLSYRKSGDEDDPDENEDSVEENTEFVVPEEDGNIFDLLDRYYLWCS